MLSVTEDHMDLFSSPAVGASVLSSAILCAAIPLNGCVRERERERERERRREREEREETDISRVATRARRPRICVPRVSCIRP